MGCVVICDIFGVRDCLISGIKVLTFVYSVLWSDFWLIYKVFSSNLVPILYVSYTLQRVVVV